MSHIPHIIQQFQLYGDLQSAKSWGGGHINDTYLLLFNQAGIEVKYILQKLNQTVFTNPEAVTNNISLVCNHLANKWRLTGVKDTSRRYLGLIPTLDGHAAFIDEDQEYWRVFLYIEKSIAFDVVQKPEQAFQAARAFARFQLGLEGLCVEEVSDTIPNFHHLGKRFDSFKKALEVDIQNRKTGVQPEIDFVLVRESLSRRIQSAIELGEIPMRIVHNDTKLSNVLLDADTGEGLCVIDLDTLMPGTLLYDFGDMVRTFSSPVSEDEADVTKVQLQMDIIEALCQGYLSEIKALLVPQERKMLLTGAFHMTFIMGIRFLTDYLQGDVYYKTKYPAHNLVRARNQFALLKSLEEQQLAIQQIIDRCLQA